ncbi:uncharacterized protein LOC142171699 [Nicotiana tabacum]|uniref:Uncharacterized protein LOC142171699 n=1 Tax=Nicotiana tabacum TaxID=4097 RepID=A0AC58T2P1_TOBAC
MDAECKRTIVGRFLKIRPQIEKIRVRFAENFSLKGSVKIGVFDNYNIFMYFTNDEDCKEIGFKRVIEIEGLQMWLQKWTPDFKPEEDIPIVPVWALLPQLTFNMHTCHYVKQIPEEIGTPLEMNLATRGRTRPSMAKVRIELDLHKPLSTSVYVGSEDEDYPLKVFVQEVEYERIPKYCKQCKKLGHDLSNCRVMERKRLAEKQEIERVKYLMQVTENPNTHVVNGESTEKEVTTAKEAKIQEKGEDAGTTNAV